VPDTPRQPRTASVPPRNTTASGGPPPTTLSTLRFDQQWTLDQVGNWDIAKLDRNGDTDFVDAGDYNDDRTHNDVNELTARDTDDNGTDNFTLTYFKTGAMNNDGENYKYVWDAWGRLRKVLNRSNDALVTEYRYNGLGFRITEYLEASTVTHHMVYDERWRIVATYREDDADPKEVFVHHAAGLSSYGSSSYIDAVILRDADLNTLWTSQSNGLDTRHYYCQNWRADVSVIIDDSATIVERVMYSPYGVPFGIPAGDLVTGATLQQPADGTVDGVDAGILTGNYSGSWNYCDLDNDGDVDAADGTVLSNHNGFTLGWGVMSHLLYHNRLGYAGYVFDGALAGTKWHVRHRVLESVLGRWLRRDPLGYVDGSNKLTYALSTPVTRVDPKGLYADNCCNGQTCSALHVDCVPQVIEIIIHGQCGLGHQLEAEKRAKLLGCNFYLETYLDRCEDAGIPPRSIDCEHLSGAYVICRATCDDCPCGCKGGTLAQKDLGSPGYGVSICFQPTSCCITVWLKLHLKAIARSFGVCLPDYHPSA
jgi:RHS repeat-associated protein